MAEAEGTLSIGQVAERTDLSVYTLRFYERKGVLLRRVSRGSGGRRVYSEQDVDWLDLCIILRASGMPLPAIRRYTELARQGTGNESERIALLRRHQDEVAARMRELRRCMDLIDFKVRVYEDILDGGEGHACDAAAPGPGNELGNGPGNGLDGEFSNAPGGGFSDGPGPGNGPAGLP